jgi:hypothetical protein
MRYELSDHEWAAIRPMLPNKPRGVARIDDRRVLNGIFWVLRSGAPWRDLPDRFGPYTTCYNRFVRWRRAGVAVRWGKRGARINTISPGIIITPLAKDELNGPRGEGYRRMIEVSPAGRAGTPDEVGTVGALLMGPDGVFITGSDFLMDGGVTAAYWYGELAPK